MGIIHATLLGIMCWAHVKPLIFFNILSVIVYLFCTLLCKFGHIMPVYISVLLEVSAYSVASVYYVGWGCGSVCFLCSIIPIVIYFGTFLFKGKNRWIIVLTLIIIYAVYVALYVRFEGARPLYGVSNAVRQVLVLFSSFVMIFSMIFYSAIYIFSSEIEVHGLERENEQLSADAKEDLLTKLLNRRGFMPLVESLMKDEKGEVFCIAFLDIDNFKRINDTNGHDCGDEVLRHITRIIRKEMHGCSICRWGGEEIIILMRGYGIISAKERLEALRKAIEGSPTVFFNKRIPVTITIGLEEYKDTYNEAEEIIKRADERMYYGKMHGKNILIYEDEEPIIVPEA